MGRCNIRAIRKQKRMPQAELAQLAGVSQTTISAAENGAGISVYSAVAICAVLKMPVNKVFEIGSNTGSKE